MATKPLNKFTVAESNNLQVYEDYYYNDLNISTSYQDLFLSSTAGGAAKK